MMKARRIVALAAMAAWSAAAGATPAELAWLDGQSLVFISPVDQHQPKVKVTILSADAPDLDQGAMRHSRIALDSERARELVALVDEIGSRTAAANALSGGPPDAYALSLTLQEHVVFGSGSSMGAALEAGFPQGMGSPTTQAAGYLVDYRLTVGRKGVERTRTFACHARSDGQVSRLPGQDVELWAPLVHGAREQCVIQLVDKLKADRSL